MGMPMLRTIVGVVVGAVAWLAIFFLLVFALAVIWPDYRGPGQLWQDQGLFTFTTPMACCMLIFWAIGDVGAGWTVMRIARRRAALWVLAGAIFAYVFTLHIILYWTTFPWWYNLGVVIPAIPAVLL